MAQMCELLDVQRGLVAQLEEAQSAIDVAEGKVDAKAGAALARETGTLRVNQKAPFVVSSFAV